MELRLRAHRVKSWLNSRSFEETGKGETLWGWYGRKREMAFAETVGGGSGGEGLGFFFHFLEGFDVGAVGEPAAVHGHEANVEIADGEDDEEGDGADGAARPDGVEGAEGEVEAEGDFDEGEPVEFFLEGAGAFFPFVAFGAGAVFGGADEFGIAAAEEAFEDGEAVDDADAHTEGHEEGDHAEGGEGAAADGFLAEHIEGAGGAGEEAAEAGDGEGDNFAGGVKEVGGEEPGGEEDEGQDDGGEINGGVGEVEEGFELDAPGVGGAEDLGEEFDGGLHLAFGPAVLLMFEGDDFGGELGGG